MKNSQTPFLEDSAPTIYKAKHICKKLVLTKELDWCKWYGLSKSH